MNKKIRDVIIIGGGAAGLMAAMASIGLKKDVMLIEKNKVLGKKLSITGNGHCNITNLYQNADCYNGSDVDRAYKIIERFTANNLIETFMDFGIEFIEKPRKNFEKRPKTYIYPATNSAKDFVSLLNALVASYVAIKTNTRVIGIEKIDGIFHIITESEGTSYTYFAKKVIVAVGGLSYPNTGSDGNLYTEIKKLGHTIKEPVEALTSIFVYEDIRELRGIRRLVRLRGLIDNNIILDEIGEVQFLETSISGIVAMQLSSKINRSIKNSSLSIDFFPSESVDSLRLKLEKRKEIQENKQVKEFLVGSMETKLATMLIKDFLNRKIVKNLTNTDLDMLSKKLKSFKLTPKKLGDFSVAQTTSGGVLLSELTENLESKILRGLYFAGEIIDVDGNCGGYNLTWALSTGYQAIRGII